MLIKRGFFFLFFHKLFRFKPRASIWEDLLKFL
jgi:hypothetical protein